MTKYIRYLICVAAIFISSAKLSQAQPLEIESIHPKKPPLFIVTEAFEPLIFSSDTQLRGMDYEITEAVFRILNIPIIIEFYPFKRCLMMVKNKQADAVIDLLANEKRLKYIFFPDEPLSESHEAIFHLKDHPPQINTLGDLKFYKVGTQLGYEYPNGLSKFLVNPEEVSTLEQNLKKLLLNRIDIILENRIVGLHTAKRMGISHRISTTNLPGEFLNRYYLGFAKKQEYNLLADQFSQVLSKFKQTKAYHEILNRYVQTQ
ncbi:substrate-binding periplasmic protein [Desulfobacter hydrogenophilus]|nr:transporter substrate-binding domain-containing protein [Desulfobacter hydrogenophilus]NDY71880.1 transporter substrate-binding domain-containing protein [Desulfobacter hydrogenophilus]